LKSVFTRTTEKMIKGRKQMVTKFYTPLASSDKLHFDELMMFALYYTNTISYIVIVLAHWSNNPRIDMLLHSDTLSWLWANKSLFILLNVSWRVLLIFTCFEICVHTNHGKNDKR
jgi:hypothetical protein